MKTASIYKDLDFHENKPVLKILMETRSSKEIRIVFKKGVELKEHKTNSPILVQVFEGSISFSVENEVLSLNKGEMVSLEPNISHSLKALEESVVRLTIYKS